MATSNMWLDDSLLLFVHRVLRLVGKPCCCDVSKSCCNNGATRDEKYCPKVVIFASEDAWASRASKTTRVFAAVTPASPNTASSTGLFSWSVKSTFLDKYSVQFV